MLASVGKWSYQKCTWYCFPRPVTTISAYKNLQAQLYSQTTFIFILENNDNSDDSVWMWCHKFHITPLPNIFHELYNCYNSKHSFSCFYSQWPDELVFYPANLIWRPEINVHDQIELQNRKKMHGKGEKKWVPKYPTTTLPISHHGGCL